MTFYLFYFIYFTKKYSTVCFMGTFWVIRHDKIVFPKITATSLHLILSHYITEKRPFKFHLISKYQSFLKYLLAYFSESYLKPITIPASGLTF